ncbi:MAG: transglutaminase-like domain-containing protein [Patescibacteria group bacterium]
MEKINKQKYLAVTKYCDYDNHNIIDFVKSYKKVNQNDKDLAIALFEYVRDNIKYRVGAWSKRASETMESQTGMCTTSTNLLVALFRAAGIPSGYCIYKVIGGESFGHILPSFIKESISSSSVHIVCFVYIDNRWIKCDPSTDTELSLKTKHIDNLTDLIIWDGEHDAVHPINEKHIISMSEPLDNIDYQLEKKPRYITKHFIFPIGNIYIDFLRKRGHQIRSREDIDKEFIKWFKQNHLSLYVKYNLFRTPWKWYKKVKNNYIVKNESISDRRSSLGSHR